MKLRSCYLFPFFLAGFNALFASNNTNVEASGKIEVKQKSDSLYHTFIRDGRIYSYGLDTLQNIKFWRRMIRLDPDSGLVNVGSTRQVLAVIPVSAYKKMNEAQVSRWRDSIRKQYNLPDTERVVFSQGKKDFYLFDRVIPQINDAIRIFEENDTDPFYAQAILLIESPGQLLKSNAGAYGPFQLMRGVARNMGLKVNKYVDERKDFAKSAGAAARLLRTICIPYTNAMLDARGICYNPDDLWYRLLVLHVYHAGAGNVEKALDKLPYCDQDGDIGIIKLLWNTKAAAFGNVSQKYSQVALACLIELDEIINTESEDIRWVEK